ncbi:emp24/gp25L/p24 family/GOLD family protein [Artemisia annua]|uniref:Emp24/gp25L/p24 family/GOLD family protein n=1 Tax=Artemisia annua TaxID=35608 RepID=A0A2U1NUK4_ARTAN|nr:emp24/gp25L/p24 family/GOLD family protein [Artemisia annua]
MEQTKPSKDAAFVEEPAQESADAEPKALGQLMEELELAAARQATLIAQVTSPYGNILHHNENATHGQFAFTTNESGQYLVCFWADDPNQGGALSVNIDWRTGIAAKDWESVAKKEKLEGVELELRKLEGAVEAIHDNLLYLKDREAEIREVSETTHSRVAWYSILSLGICVAVSAAQLWYLTRFFQKKKLI